MSEGYDPRNEFETPDDAMRVVALASSLLAERRRAALTDFVLSALEQLGVDSPKHETLAEALRELEIQYCKEALAALADEDMKTASQMKRLIDELWPPTQ